MKKLFLLFFALTYNIILSQNGWIQKSDLGGSARHSAIGASIGTKGYIGLGSDINGSRLNDLWEWDKATETWTQKADFIGSGRTGAIGFVIENKLYVGTGYDGTTKQNDFYEYDPSTNIWVQKANIPVGRSEGVGFSIGNKGYIVTGSTNSNPLGSNDLWEYDPSTNIWAQKANIPTTITFEASGFSVGTKGYVLVNKYNFWEYTPDTDSWAQKANIGVTYNTSRAIDFSLNGKGYIGAVGQNQNELWEYSPTTNAWQHVSNIPDGNRVVGTGFVVENVLYIGTGLGTIHKKDFWEGNPSNFTLSIDDIGEDDYNKNLISVFPNPSKELIRIKIATVLIGSTYSIIDPLGKKVHGGKLSSQTSAVNIGALKAGIYFIKIKGRSNFTYKIFKY